MTRRRARSVLAGLVANVGHQALGPTWQSQSDLAESYATLYLECCMSQQPPCENARINYGDSPSMPSVDANGITINYQVEGSGNGELVVLVNGLADDLQTWDFQVPALLEAGYKVLR